MAKYLLDGRALQNRSAVRGIGTYLRGLLDGYASLGAVGEVSLMLSRGAIAPEAAAASGVAIASARVPVVKRRLQPILDPFFIPGVIRAARPQLYHGLEYGQPIRSSVPVVITVHDLIQFIFPGLYPWTRRERLLGMKLLRHADALIASSRATADDLVAIAHADPARISVIPLGVSDAFRPADPGAITGLRARLGLGDRRFLLAVGTFDPRKRVDLTAAVVAAVRRHHDVDLVIAGSQGSFEPAVREAMERAHIADNCHHLGYVDEPDLVGLLSSTSCLVFTSAYEGFGLPPLEAMACGAPVAVFDNSSLPGVVGTNALICPNRDAQAMADAICQLLANPGRAAHHRDTGPLWAAQFTWARTARATLDIYEGLLRRAY